jgi:Zn-dependent M28 family amino/carboxypeptidase
MSNVAGLLRGSDPTLANTYVILSAHYDHVGMAEPGPEAAADLIFNGANDDGSGTVSVIEIASALAGMNPRPKRSILFITFFGEERGMLGSRYYAEHPLVPAAQTIAHLNLEQLGRTDASNGSMAKSGNLTGYDFSSLPRILADAAGPAGVRIWKDEQSSDPFFARSDNAAIAALGIPAHTLSVAYEFPDYHKVSDHWDKIDYDNMSLVNRAIALGLMRLASDVAPPEWNADYPAAQRYVEAARRLHEAKASGAVK